MKPSKPSKPSMPGPVKGAIERVKGLRGSASVGPGSALAAKLRANLLSTAEHVVARMNELELEGSLTVSGALLGLKLTIGVGFSREAGSLTFAPAALASGDDGAGAGAGDAEAAEDDPVVEEEGDIVTVGSTDKAVGACDSPAASTKLKAAVDKSLTKSLDHMKEMGRTMRASISGSGVSLIVGAGLEFMFYGTGLEVGLEVQLTSMDRILSAE